MLLAAGRRGRAGSRGCNPGFDIDSPQAECPLPACKMGTMTFTWLLEEVTRCIRHLGQQALFYQVALQVQWSGGEAHFKSSYCEHICS